MAAEWKDFAAAYPRSRFCLPASNFWWYRIFWRKRTIWRKSSRFLRRISAFWKKWICLLSATTLKRSQKNCPDRKVWAFLLWFLCFVFHVGKGKQNTLIDKFVSADVSLRGFLIQNFQNILWNPHGDYFLFRFFRMKYICLHLPLAKLYLVCYIYSIF